MPKSKKFIDKKSVTFQLLYRSQQDPLIADDTAPQRVLVLQESKNKQKNVRRELNECISINGDEVESNKCLAKGAADKTNSYFSKDKQSEEQYENIINSLPAEVFPSSIEDEIGMLARAAPQSGLRLDLDPDIVAAMDDDFAYDDPDNQLEDDFIQLADGLYSDEEIGNTDEDDLFESDASTNSEFSLENEETKSRFTNYSMSSSVIRRNAHLSLLDDRFEMMYADYDENEIGALDCDEIEGHVDTSVANLQKYVEKCALNKGSNYLPENVNTKKKVLQTVVEEDSDDELRMVEVNKEKPWDCESILSTYSNIYNHPKLITTKPFINVDKKLGYPIEQSETKLTKSALNKLNREMDTMSLSGTKSVAAKSVLSQLSELSIRLKNETPEERKKRKMLLKVYQRDRRKEKKLNKLAFKEEMTKQRMNTTNNVKFFKNQNYTM